MKWIHRKRLTQLLEAIARHDLTEPVQGALNTLNQAPASYRGTGVMPADVLIEVCERERFGPFAVQGRDELLGDLRWREDSMVRFHHILTETHRYEAVTDPKTTQLYGVEMTTLGTPRQPR
jgi:hypothetical protein